MDTNTRLPWEPLERRLSLLFGMPRHQHGCTCLPDANETDQDWWWVRQPCWTVSDAASLLGVTTRTVRRWMREGLNWRQADLAAVAAGLTPDRLWPAWETISADDADRIEEARERARRKKLDDNAARKARRRLQAVG